jgi:hypothetical protein
MNPVDFDRSILAEETRRAWQTAVAVSALLAMGEIGYAIVELPVVGVHPMVDLRGAHVALSLGVLLVLLKRRALVTFRECVMWFFVVSLPLLPIMWVAEQHLARAGAPWSPFAGFKFVVFPAALMTPGPLYFAGLLTLTIGLEAVVAYYALNLSHNPWASPGEPGATIVFTLIACGLIVYRAQVRRAEREVARVRAEADAFERLATMFLALRDGAGTPLQTLEVGIQLLREPGGDRVATSKRMVRALDELREIHRLFANCEEYVRRKSGVTSFDARATLEELEREFRDQSAPRRRPFFRWRSSV